MCVCVCVKASDFFTLFYYSLMVLNTMRSGNSQGLTIAGIHQYLNSSLATLMINPHYFYPYTCVYGYTGKPLSLHSSTNNYWQKTLL